MAINRSESVKRLNLNEFEGYSELSRSDRQEAKRLIGEFLVDKINEFLDRSSSPVEGGQFKRQLEKGGRSRLFEEGDMRSQITFSEQGSKVAVGIFRDAPEVERLKSFNHNTGDTLPTRQFIPRPGEEFRPSINRGIESIIRRFQSGQA